MVKPIYFMNRSLRSANAPPTGKPRARRRLLISLPVLFHLEAKTFLALLHKIRSLTLKFLNVRASCGEVRDRFAIGAVERTENHSCNGDLAVHETSEIVLITKVRQYYQSIYL